MCVCADRVASWKAANKLAGHNVTALASVHSVESLLTALSTMACYAYSPDGSQLTTLPGTIGLGSEAVATLPSHKDVSGVVGGGASAFKPKKKKAPRVRSSLKHQMHEHDLRRYVSVGDP